MAQDVSEAVLHCVLATAGEQLDARSRHALASASKACWSLVLEASDQLTVQLTAHIGLSPAVWARRTTGVVPVPRAAAPRSSMCGCPRPSSQRRTTQHSA